LGGLAETLIVFRKRDRLSQRTHHVADDPL
jgi:hypothetical protein